MCGASAARRRGKTFTCEVNAASPWVSNSDARLEIRDPCGGMRIAEKVVERGDPVRCCVSPLRSRANIRSTSHDTSFRRRAGVCLSSDHNRRSLMLIASIPAGASQARQQCEIRVLGAGTGEPLAVTLPADGQIDSTHRLTIAGKTTNAILLDLDDLPEYRHEDHLLAVAVPAILNARSLKPRADPYLDCSFSKKR